jgi:hypothetical protein
MNDRLPAVQRVGQQMRWRTVWAIAVVSNLLCVAQSGLATVTLAADIPGLLVRRLTMRVGNQLIGAVSTVGFDVTGANTSPTPTPVTGVPSASSAPASAPANAVRISVSNRYGIAQGNRVIVTVDSSAGMACSAGPCGSTTIPFNTISWTASSLATGTYAGQDFGSGTFNGSGSQTLLDFSAAALQNFSIVNDWVFSYSNATLYPAGTYRGTVRFTATMP